MEKNDLNIKYEHGTLSQTVPIDTVLIFQPLTDHLSSNLVAGFSISQPFIHNFKPSVFSLNTKVFQIYHYGKVTGSNNVPDNLACSRMYCCRGSRCSCMPWSRRKVLTGWLEYTGLLSTLVHGVWLPLFCRLPDLRFCCSELVWLCRSSMWLNTGLFTAVDNG